MISPLFVHLRSELILEGCLTEFLSAWWLENISMDLVFLYSRFSISTELFEINSWKTKSREIGNWRAGRVLSFPSDRKEHVLEKPTWKKLDLELSDLSKVSVCLRKLGLSTRSCGAKGNKQGKAESSTTTTTCTKKLQAEKL